MNHKLYEAAILRLKSNALESLATLEQVLNSPRPGPGMVNEVVEHSLNLVQYEGAMLSLQQYFQPRPPGPHPGPATPTGPPKVVTPDMSPTYKKSLADQKIRETAKKTKGKKK